MRIIVRDDGAGIPAEILQQIFPPFLAPKQAGKGAGLELAVSCSLVERPNAGVEVHSELGRRATFTVTLPSDTGRASAATRAKR